MIPSCKVKLMVRVLVASETEVLTACAFLLNDILLKRASKGAPFWCDISISCPLLSLRIVFEALHLLHAQNESTAGH